MYLLIFLVTATLFAAFLLLFVYLVLLAFGFWIRHETKFDEPAEVAIVMGSFPMKALPRVQKAAQLYHQGLVGKLILSGKPPIGKLTEARWMYEQALQLGVAADDMFLEEKATNTKENAVYARPIIEANQFKSVIIIHQEFEQVRAVLTTKKQLADLSLRLISQPATAMPYWDRWTWMLHSIGWRYTWATVSRLIKYRLKGDL